VRLTVEKLLETVEIVQKIVEETTLVQEDGWVYMVVNILSQALIVLLISKAPIGLERNALALVLYRI
jgi:hypothetical protein